MCALRLPILALMLGGLALVSPRAAAQGGLSESPSEARAFFDLVGLFQDGDERPDPLRGFLFEDESGQLTTTGTLLYRYLREAESAREGNRLGERLEELSASFEGVRAIGACSTTRREAMDAAVRRTRDRFSGDPLGGPDYSLFLHVSLYGAFDAGARFEGSDDDFSRRTMPDEFVYFDGGEALRREKMMAAVHASWGPHVTPIVMSLRRFEGFKAEQEAQGQLRTWTFKEVPGGITWNRKVVALQKEMNRHLPRCEELVGGIPLDGHYNHAMYLYYQCRVEKQALELQLMATGERTSRLCQLLGMDVAGSDLVDLEKGTYKGTLLAKVEERGGNTELPSNVEWDEGLGPRPNTILEYVDRTMADAVERIGDMRQYIANLEAGVERDAYGSVISKGKFASFVAEVQLHMTDLAGMLLELERGQALHRRAPLRFTFDLRTMLDAEEE